MDPLPIHLALHGDGWWTCTITAPNGKAVTTRTDADADIVEAFSLWVSALAEGRLPDAVLFDEEPEETTVSVKSGQSERAVRIVVTHNGWPPERPRPSLDFEMERWELGRSIDTALWLLGKRGDWSETVQNWLADEPE